MVILKNIKKEYREFSISEFSLEIKEGEFVTLLGESGCGKTTLLRIVSGIIGDYEGQVIIGNEDVREKSPGERGLSMVFQDPLLLPNLSVEDNVAFGLKMRGIPRKDRVEKVREVLEVLELRGFEKRHPHQLSGGQKQRVSLGRALVMEPKLLLMDEPFSALDENLREKLQQMLKEIQKKYGMTVLFVTHDRDEAFYLSDKIALMDKKGGLLQFDTPKNLYENPKSIFVAMFLGINNIFKGKVRGGTAYCSGLEVSVDKTEKEEVCLALKAEDIRVTLNDDKCIEEEVLVGVIKDCSFKRGFYHFKVESSGEIIEVVQNRADFPPEYRGKVFIRYRREDIVYI